MKILAKIQAPYRTADTDPAHFQVDYFFASGPRRNDSVSLLPSSFIGEGQLVYKLKVLLVAYLKERYTPENFTTNDILFL